MNEEIIKRRLILDLAVKDLFKVINFIDGKSNNHSNDRISSLTEIQYLDYETKLINEIKMRVESIFNS